MSTPYLIVVICCHKNEGFNFNLLEHFFRHYFSCGIMPRNSYVTVISDGSQPKIIPYLTRIGVNIAKKICSIRYDPHTYTLERQSLQKCIPDNSWVINPEIEEFIAFTKPIPRLIQEMEVAGYNALSGWLWDRFDQKFILKDVHPQHPIYLQFPIAIEYTREALFENTRKEALVKNCFIIQPGAKYLDANGYAIHSAPPDWHLRVDHYKWILGLKQRVEKLYEIALRETQLESCLRKYKFLLSAIQSSPKGDILTNETPIRTFIRFPKTGSERLRYIHVPKTAGTTIVNVINQWFPGIYRINSWDNLNEVERANLKKESIICGHIPLRYFPIDGDRDTKWFTVLRDPIEQAISCYYEAAKNIAHRSPDMQDLIETGLESLILSGKFNDIWTDSTRFLSSLPREADIELALQSAKQNIHKFALVGFYENLNVFVKKMALILNKEPPKTLPWENSNFYKPNHVKISQEARNALERITMYDRELYKYALQVFGEEVKKK